MRVLDEAYIKRMNDTNSILYMISHAKPDHTKLKKEAREFENAMEIEHKKNRQLIAEALRNK